MIKFGTTPTEFDLWWKSNQNTFFQVKWNERQIAYAAWQEAMKLAELREKNSINNGNEKKEASRA